MLHRTIFNSYVCKANNNVREGRSLSKVPKNWFKNKSPTSYFQKNKENSIRKQENVFRKQKTETKLKAMEKENNAQKTEKLKPKWIHDLNGNNGDDRLSKKF